VNFRPYQSTLRCLRPVLGDFSPLLVDGLGSLPCCGGDLIGQRGLERFGERASDVLGVVDVDLLEDGLVELSPDDVGGFEVGGVPVGGECGSFGEVGFGLAELDVDGLEAGFGSVELPAG
jgi:hypothetical protein